MINVLSETLHVVSGHSAAGCLKQALRVRNDRVLVGDPHLHCGPAPAMDDLIAWHRMRESYCSTLFETYIRAAFDRPMPPTVTFGDEPETETGPHIDGQRLAEAGEVHVWVTRGLADQLQLAWIVFLFDRFGLDLAKLHVIQFQERVQNWPLLTLGELSPEAINRLNPGAAPLGPEHTDDLRRAWRAYTGSEPGGLVDFIAGPSASSVLHRAMAELVHRYPDIRTGLSRWDMVLLQQTIENGPLLHRVLAHAMAACDTPDWVSDDYLFDRILKLGGPAVRSPLIALNKNQYSDNKPQIQITEFGREVLAGKANHVTQNHIDEWVGGVHLSPDTLVFREDTRLLLS